MTNTNNTIWVRRTNPYFGDVRWHIVSATHHDRYGVVCGLSHVSLDSEFSPSTPAPPDRCWSCVLYYSHSLIRLWR